MTKSLTLKLKVEEDDELRNYIKELIRGQVTSVLREELKQYLGEVVKSKIDQRVCNLNINDELKKIIIEEARKALPANNWGKPSAIKEIATQEVRAMIKKELENVKLSSLV